MRKKSINAVLLCLICFSLFFLLTAAGKSEREQDMGEERSKVNEEIIIPTVNDVRLNGYPQNEMGETYGPDVWESIEEPELILVSNEHAQEGYVRQSDFDDGVTTLEEAAHHKPRQYTVNMYLQDGCTVIGTFTIVDCVKGAVIASPYACP